MVLPIEEENLVYDIKLSSVGPGHISGLNAIHNLSGMDLAMKLHYLKAVYFFSSEAVQGLTIVAIKETMFTLLNHFYVACGRFRRSESGRPFLKCNDCGARFVEAKCKKTMNEWLKCIRDWSLYKLLTPQQVIGPELSFSPPVLFQITQFQCGGISLGLSWAHVLGDPFTASVFINTWGQVLRSLRLNKPHSIGKQCPRTKIPENPYPLEKEPLSAKRVDPVGDHWLTPNNCKMDTFSFHLTTTLLDNLQAQIWGPRSDQAPTFESLCAMIWQCIAKVREGSAPESKPETRTVTICKTVGSNKGIESLGNNQRISIVETELPVINTDLKKLATLLAEQATEETTLIEKVLNNDQGVADFIVYGANLTFVDLEEIDLYDVEVKGEKPEFVYYSLQGVGDAGTVLVLPWKRYCDGIEGEGRLVTVTVPEAQVIGLKCELKEKGLLFESSVG